MQEQHGEKRHSPSAIVVPSRSDPLLRTMTEPVGGPLGRRAAPGLNSPGFFTVERVLVLMAGISALFAVVSKSHCRMSGWHTPDQFSTVCWSQFPATLVQSFGLAESGPDTGTSQAPLVGVVIRFTAWLSRGDGSSSASQLAFFDINAALIAVVWLFTVVVLARTAGRRPWDAAVLAASPLLWLSAYVSWDFWAVALATLGIYLFARRRTLWAGFVLGLAVMAAPYALLILLAIIVLGVRNRQGTQTLEFLAAGLVGWLVVLAPVIAFDPSGWGAYLGGFITRAASESSVYGGWNLMAERLGLPLLDANAVNTLVVVLVVLVVAAVAAVGRYAPQRPRLAQLAALAVGGFIIVNKFTEPWHAVWLLPLLALAIPRWRPLLLWQAALLTHFIALMLFQSKVFGDINAQHAIDMPYFLMASVLAGAATCVILGLIARDVWRPRHDVIRRGSVDDPQGGVLLNASVGEIHEASGRHACADPARG
ncbi:hypothetical protein [Arthrobacter cryoconiti]|uniref:Integral membrane protein n=1 Tax=Arthrobacter cryoconiti TaxID=748907 RepID=A0ABV8R1U3_9MICC|nr:hypothetical protein [Arthrobacter cryoconiti]MCC9067815.1 hypothetical protein [Arthrobacter cryoconiti]